MNLFSHSRQALAGLMAVAVALLLVTLTFTSQPNAQARSDRGNGQSSLLGYRGQGKSLQERVAKKLAGTYWGTVHDVPIVDDTAEGGFRLESYNTIVDFDADGTFNLTSTNMLGDIEIFGGQGLFLGSGTTLRGSWKATGRNSFEAVGVSIFRRTDLKELPEAQKPTMVLRVHLIGTISDDGNVIDVPYKIVPLPCGSPTDDGGFAFSQYGCGDASADIPAWDDLEAPIGSSTGVRISVAD